MIKALHSIYGRKNIPVSFDTDALAYFAAVVSQGSVVSDAYKTLYNNTIIALKSSGQWDELDCLYIDATGDKQWALTDVRNPTRTATKVGSYAGEWTVGLGFKGDGSAFALLTNFNPTIGVNKFTQNSSSFGALFIDNNSVASTWDLGAANAGFSSGNLIRAYQGATNEGAGAINSAFFGTNTYKKPILNSYAWIGWNRTASNVANNYFNGVNIETNTQTSTTLINLSLARFGAYNGSFAGGFYSSNRQACFYAGSGLVSQKEIINALTINFFTPQATKAATTKRIIFEGDSRTGDASIPSLSNGYAMPKRALSNLGDNWIGAAVSKANDTVQTMVTQYATEVAPYVNTSFIENVFVLWAGTNDIAAGRTAVQIKTDIESVCNSAKAQGYKVVIVGEIDRNWGGSYAALNAVRAAYRTLILADFPTTTIYANTYKGASYADILIDPYSEANFQNYASAWYQVDGIHPNTTGSDIIAGYVSNALLL